MERVGLKCTSIFIVIIFLFNMILPITIAAEPNEKILEETGVEAKNDEEENKNEDKKIEDERIEEK